MSICTKNCFKKMSKAKILAKEKRESKHSNFLYNI